MSLLQEAKRIAAEFELSDEDVQKSVTEFVRQMGMKKFYRNENILLTSFLQMRVCKRMGLWWAKFPPMLLEFPMVQKR